MSALYKTLKKNDSLQTQPTRSYSVNDLEEVTLKVSLLAIYLYVGSFGLVVILLLPGPDGQRGMYLKWNAIL